MATMASGLASPGLLGGMNAERLADRYSVRGAPTNNPVGAVDPDSAALWGTAGLLQNITRARQAAGEDVTIPTEQEAREQVAANTNRVNSTLRPTKKGVAALRQYVNAAYPDGTGMPAYIRDALEAERRGGMNDVVLAENVERDIRRRQQAGLPVVSMPGYLLEADQAVGNLVTAQNAEALGPTGWGLPGQLLGTALGALTGNPYLGAIAGGIGGAGAGGFQGAALGALGGFGAGGGFDGLSLFDQGGFVNPSALGLSGENLALPGLANAPAATPVAGYGASALGLTGANLALPGLANAPAATPVSGYGASAVGGDPTSLYASPALGEAAGGNWTDVLDSLDSLGDVFQAGSGLIGEGEQGAGPGILPMAGGAPRSPYVSQTPTMNMPAVRYARTVDLFSNPFIRGIS